MMKEVEEFLNSNRPNTWIEYPDMSVYVRKGIHRCGKTFDVASIEVRDIKRGNGVFTKWLNELEQFVLASKLPIYVENVSDERFQKFFENRAYEKIDDESGGFNVSYLKRSLPVNFKDASFQDWENELRAMPRTWIPSMLRILIEEAQKKNIFKHGGLEVFVKNVSSEPIKANNICRIPGCSTEAQGFYPYCKAHSL